MKVCIYHNVQRECRQCGQPVVSLGNEQWAHEEPGRGHVPASVSKTGWDGYQAGHAMVRVLETEVPDGLDAEMVAELMFEAGNCDPDMLGRDRHGIDLAAVALSYRLRRLRSVSVGDVVAVGEIPLAVASAGFSVVEGTFNVTWCGEPGSEAVPHCSYCHATGDQATLERFNTAGNLACRNVMACSDRQRAARLHA